MEDFVNYTVIVDVDLSKLERLNTQRKKLGLQPKTANDIIEEAITDGLRNSLVNAVKVLHVA